MNQESSSIDRESADSIRAGTRLLLVSNDAIRARRRPAAIVGVWLFEAAIALMIAWPITRAVASSYADRPDGDAPLFADGGDALVAWLSDQRAAMASIAATISMGVFAALVLGIVPLIMLLTSLAYTTQDLRAPRPPHLLPYVARGFWPMLGVLGASALVQALLGGIGIGLASWACDHFDDRLGEARAGQLWIAIVVIFAAAVAVVGVVADLARASVVRYRHGFFAAVRSGFSAFKKQKAVLVWSWAWRALVGVSLLAGSALVSARLGGRPGVALAALAGLHQLIVLFRVALRTSWLARALRAVDVDG